MATTEQVVDAHKKYDGNIQKISQHLGVARTSVYHHLRKAGIKRPTVDGKIKEIPTKSMPLPKEGGVYRYILTSAQNNTHVNQNVWSNLLAIADHYGADIMVGTLSYNTSVYGEKSVKRGKSKDDSSKLWYCEEVTDFIVDDRVELAPGLIWCGEMNILPTATRPLSGLETYTQRASGIFPHTKFAMESVASGKREPTKFNYTTGTTTMRNYIAKKAGMKADFHHGYGGLIVEVDSKGNWWVRQLNADSTGRIYDLDIVAEGGTVYESDRVEAITWGDIHSLMLDPVVEQSAWGDGGMLDTLNPKFQFVHDVLAGAKINHHEAKNPHEQYRLHVCGWESVTAELQHGSDFLKNSHRKSTKTVVVYSNHDEPWILRWLRESDYRKDPVNAMVFLELQLEVYRSIYDNTDINVFENAMRNRGCPRSVKFLREDEPFAICNKKIECGIHGHRGPNGTKGTPLALSKMGKKANTAHTHSAGIIDGLYVAGACAKLDWKYARGPSSWSHSHIVTYPNGKRTIVTVWDGKWRA